MKANDLRIGNFVTDNSECIYEVTAINDSTIWVKRGECIAYIDIEYVYSIPLSEEWLLKFGWIWNDECNSYEKYPNGDARMNLSYHSINNGYTMFNYVLKATIVERIWYAHQLQNIYFALTGYELELTK